VTTYDERDEKERTRLSPVFEQVHSGETIERINDRVEAERDSHEDGRKAHRPFATKTRNLHELQEMKRKGRK